MKIVYMWTAIEETNIKAILADMNTNELVVKIRTEKKTQARTRFEPRGHGRSWETMGSNPVRAWIFFQALFSLLVQ